MGVEAAHGVNDAGRILQRIPAYPPLGSWIVEAVAVVIQSAVDMDFFAGEAINVGAGEGAAAGDGVAERIVTVSGDTCLVAVEHVGDVAVAVGEIIIVGAPVAGGAGISVGTGKQAADSARAFHAAAEVAASRVADQRSVISVALLDDAPTVVNVMGFGIENGVAVCGGAAARVGLAADALGQLFAWAATGDVTVLVVLLANAQAAKAVVGENG